MIKKSFCWGYAGAARADQQSEAGRIGQQNGSGCWMGESRICGLQQDWLHPASNPQRVLILRRNNSSIMLQFILHKESLLEPTLPSWRQECTMEQPRLLDEMRFNETLHSESTRQLSQRFDESFVLLSSAPLAHSQCKGATWSHHQSNWWLKYQCLQTRQNKSLLVPCEQ